MKRVLTAVLAVTLMSGTMVKGHTFNLARTAGSEPLTHSEKVFNWFTVALGGDAPTTHTKTAGMYPAESAENSLFWRGVGDRIAGL